MPRPGPFSALTPDPHPHPVKKPRPKTIGGAPRSGKWTRQPDDRRLGGRNRGALIGLAILALVLLGGMGAYLGWADAQLRRGLLRQAEVLRGRTDWVALEELPPRVVVPFATVLDTTGFARRGLRDAQALTTVSHDLVRQVHRLDGGVADRARELAMAPLLEARTGPDGLLELYLNRVSFGRAGEWPVYGIRAAARDYFGTEPAQLSLGEAATLAGMLLEPRLADPEAEPAAVGARRREVLRMLLLAGRIDADAFRAALAEPLGFQPGADYAPMARPLDWQEEPGVIRLPESLRPRPDSAVS